MKNTFLKCALALSLFGFGSLAMSQDVEAASGSVTSYVATEPIVGVWIEVEGGGSGWATLRGRGSQTASWSYNTRGRRFKAHIGVGGSPEKWGRTCKTDWVNDRNGIMLEAYGIPGLPWVSWAKAK